MKYFRHLSTGRKGDRLKPIYAQFGKAKGYGMYFLLLEMCAEKYNGTQTKFVFLKSELTSELSLINSRLELVLTSFKVHSLIFDFQFTQDGNVVELWVPDLIEISDDYTQRVRRQSEISSEKVAPKKRIRNKTKTKNKTNRTQSNLHTPPQEKMKTNLNWVLESWNSTVTDLPSLQKINDKRHKTIEKAFDEYSPDEKFWQTYFMKIQDSDFLTGRKTDWKANFDWCFKSDNILKILEGQYSNNSPRNKNKVPGMERGNRELTSRDYLGDMYDSENESEQSEVNQ